MTKILTSCTLVSLCMISLNLQAQDFQVEFSPVIGNVDFSVDSASIDGDVMGVGVLYHLRPVSTASGPLAEAAYINKAASLGANYQQLSINDTDIDTVGLTARFVTQQNTIVQLTATDEDLDESTTVGISIGKYLDDYSTLSGFVSRATIESDDDGTEIDSEVITIGIAGRKLVEASSLDTHVALEGSISYATAEVTVSDDFFGTDSVEENGFGISAGLTYYASPQLGLGVQFSRVDIDTSEATAFGLSAEYFFTESIAVRAQYSQTDIDILEFDTWLATLVTRF